jgi:alpha-ketoglutarate-dependent taurine dioxygenase
MNVSTHENGWTIVVKDFDLRIATQNQINTLAKYLLTNTVVVFKNQQLSPDDQVQIASMFGTLEDYSPPGAIRENFISKDGSKRILRVTGEPDEHGLPGMFGHVSELDWHANRVTYPNRKPIIWLYGVRGTKGSRTSYINFIEAYKGLTDQQKLDFEKIELDVGTGANAFQAYYSDLEIKNRHYPRLIHTNQLGIKSLFFPFTQIHFIKDWDQIESRKFIDDLRDNYVLDEKFMYHHDWEDGDLVLAEQWSGVHKRWEFAHMDRRVLHRIATDFSNVVID